MSVFQPSRQRCVPVRLIDVPLERRRRAATQVIRKEADPLERLRIRLLAENPPPTLVAWVRP